MAWPHFHNGGSLGVLCSFCLLFLPCLLCSLTDPGSPGFDRLFSTAGCMLWSFGLILEETEVSDCEICTFIHPFQVAAKSNEFMTKYSLKTRDAPIRL